MRTLLTLSASSSGFLIETRLFDIGRIRFSMVSSGLFVYKLYAFNDVSSENKKLPYPS